MQKYSFILNLTRKADFSANIFLPQISRILPFPPVVAKLATNIRVYPCDKEIRVIIFIISTRISQISRILFFSYSCSEARNKNPCPSVSIRVQKNLCLI